MNLRTITGSIKDYPVKTVAGIVFALLFLPVHTIRLDEYWALTRMGWWICFLLYVNELHQAYKNDNKLLSYKVPSVWHPADSKWINRWGMSWKSLTIIMPTMLVTLFFIMLVMFA